MKAPIAVNPEAFASQGANWKVTMTSPALAFVSSADTKQEAIDEVVDWLEDNLPLLLLTVADMENLPKRNLEFYTYGGTHHRYVATKNIKLSRVLS